MNADDAGARRSESAPPRERWRTRLPRPNDRGGNVLLPRGSERLACAGRCLRGCWKQISAQLRTSVATACETQRQHRLRHRHVLGSPISSDRERHELAISAAGWSAQNEIGADDEATRCV